tara:strand:+ start:112 stop:1044 length:933 start_codon:yes stop_codon:yes gene_type:complete
MKRAKILNYLFIIFFLFQFSNVFSKISNSIVITVGNLPITYLDLVKEMRLIAIVSNNKIENSNKEQIKNVAAKSLIKRKIKEIEIKKYSIKNFNKNDLKKLISQTSINLGTNEDGLKKIMNLNNLDFKYLEHKYEVDLKWNSLIFELYKNKVVLNMGEVEEILNNTVQNMVSRKDFLLSEIEINLPNNEMQLVIKKIMRNIEMEGFENTAKKYSISQTAERGGSLGWMNEKKLSRKILENIKDLKTNEVGKPIILENSIVFLKKMGEKVYEKDVKKLKDNIIKIEKEKKLKMFSNSHYSNLERVTQINFL